MDLGFYNKIYKKVENDETKVYNYYESETGEYYRREIIKLTKEEDEALSKYIVQTKYENSALSLICKIIGLLMIIVFFILGIIFGDKFDSVGISLLYIIVGIISSVPIFALAKIIDLLNKISLNTENRSTKK